MFVANRYKFSLKVSGTSFDFCCNMQELCRIGGGLSCISTGNVHPSHRHMLMASDKQVKTQFPCQLAGDVLLAVRKDSACFQILFKSSVIDADAHITLGFKGLIGLLSGGESIGNTQMFQVCRLLPNVHKICHHTGDAYPQAIFQGVHLPGMDGKFSP